MPTWLIGWEKKTRSPGCRSAFRTGVPTDAIAREVRGSDRPLWANDHLTRPEQSKAFGPIAPQRYGFPSLASAVVIAALRIAAGEESAVVLATVVYDGVAGLTCCMCAACICAATPLTRSLICIVGCSGSAGGGGRGRRSRSAG